MVRYKLFSDISSLLLIFYIRLNLASCHVNDKCCSYLYCIPSLVQIICCILIGAISMY